MADPLHLLCVEPRFPGRLGGVADWLVRRRGWRCRFYCTGTEPRDQWPEAVGRGLDLVVYPVGGVARESRVTWTRHLERGLCYAYGCWEALAAKPAGPVDVVLGRSAGLGSTLFVPARLPHTPVVNLFDYYQHAHRHDLADEAEPDTPAAYFQWRRSANAVELLDLENGVHAWTLTRWQRELFPPEYRDGFRVLYDGVDTRRFTRHAGGERSVAGRPIPAGTRVVTFAARSLERLRGFDRFLEYANRLLRTRADVLCIVVGAPTVRRGLDVSHYQQDYKADLLRQTPLHDAERVWFLGEVPQPTLAEAMAVSDLHLYPARPYTVSRSLVEAMAAGCVILAANHEPVRDFLTHGQTGLLVPADVPEAWERQALAVLDDPAAYRSLGEAAAARVREQYDQDVTLDALADWLDGLCR
jgi:glycosyltransferase involved in cell wall biosynthesis